MRKLLLAMLAGACAASSAQAVTYAQYKIDVFGSSVTYDPLQAYKQIDAFNFIKTYTINLASTDFSGAPDGNFHLVFFDSSSLATIYYGGFFNDNISVTSSLAGVDGLPNLETAFITGSSWSYGSTGPGTGSPVTLYSGSVKFASTTFSTDRFSGPVVSESDMVFPAPEPATWATMVLGFGVAGYAMRRKPKVSFA